MIGTLAVDGWAVTFGTAKRGLGGLGETILVFSYQTLWQYSDWDPLTRASNAGGRQKLRFSTNIWLHCVLSTVRPASVIHTAALDRRKLATLIPGKRRRLLFAGDDDDEMFMTRSLNVAPKTTEQNLIVRNRKSEAVKKLIIKDCARGIVL